jgi:hypothetical protein
MFLKCTDHSCSRRNSCKHYAPSVIAGYSEAVHPTRSLIRADRDYAVEPDPNDNNQPTFILACHCYQSRYCALPVQTELLYEIRLQSFKTNKEEAK